MKNIGYFLREAGRIIRYNRVSNIFSFLGTGLILFLLGLVVAVWGISSQLVVLLQQEAEISAYFDKSPENPEDIINSIKLIDGVWNVRYVGAEEARVRMENILGDESYILDLFEKNPFEPYIEIRIHLDQIDPVLQSIKNIKGIDYVRDNRGVLEQIKGITRALEILGYLVIAAVSITTLVIISHMIRQGIYHNREQIKTLRLLGAPDSFIGFPFVLVGFLLTFGGGLLAAVLITILINRGYGQLGGTLPFIPLPPKDRLLLGIVTLLLSGSAALGILGSLFGLSSISKENHG
ncbi:MAG TPA: hypothetical protein DCE11_03285 [Ruminiclostridium sp.]|jgi:cell division transport system permease protein|nr:hypothetical protein [Clostridiaceae bacterium]HAA25131.1 hypothetical protein [Ruminiclostridium sp.]